MSGSAFGIEPLELLYEPPGLPAFDVPPEIRALYPGTLGVARPSLAVNFVSTIDGIVSIPGTPRSNRLISDESDPDRFVMALLRACADVVLISSGTLNGSPNGLWSATDAYPPAAEAIADLRRGLDLPPEPTFAVLTGSGSLNPEHPALVGGALILTTEHGAAALAGRLRDGVEVAVLPGEEKVDLAAAVAHLHARGLETILSEAGPTMLGAMLAEGLIDELFLTVSPLLAGRSGEDVRLGLVEGIDLLPTTRVAGELRGIRRNGAHLFLRYGF